MRVTFERNKLVTEVTGTDVLSLADAKTWLRVDSSDEDALITSLIDVAVGAVQSYIGQSLVEIDTFLFGLPDFSDEVLPVGPLNSVNSITYYDQGTICRRWRRICIGWIWATSRSRTFFSASRCRTFTIIERSR